MNKTVSLAAAALLAAAVPARSEDKPREAMPLNDVQKISYVVAQQMGNSLRTQGVAVDVGVFMASFQEAVDGKPSRFSPDETKQVIQRLQEVVAEHQKTVAVKNKADGEAFLKANKKKKGVKATSSGLQYRQDRPGKGAPPKAEDRVKVNYRGTLTDGKEFDSSYKRGQPAEFPLNGVIRGWTEGLQLMAPGSKYTLFVPADLAYGDEGRPGTIPPGSVLVFEVELLEVVK